jgi:hypothetical protein
MVSIMFAHPETPIMPDSAILTAGRAFSVHWGARNIGEDDVPAFIDLLVVTHIPEGCPGSDDTEHEVVYESEVEQAELAAGQVGELKSVEVPSLSEGAYRLTVTLANDLGIGESTFNCINVDS